PATRIDWDRLGRIVLVLVLFAVLLSYLGPTLHLVGTWRDLGGGAPPRPRPDASPGWNVAGLAGRAPARRRSAPREQRAATAVGRAQRSGRDRARGARPRDGLRGRAPLRGPDPARQLSPAARAAPRPP